MDTITQLLVTKTEELHQTLRLTQVHEAVLAQLREVGIRFDTTSHFADREVTQFQLSWQVRGSEYYEYYELITTKISHEGQPVEEEMIDFDKALIVFRAFRALGYPARMHWQRNNLYVTIVVEVDGTFESTITLHASNVD